jgi:hypothetical protein
LALAVYRQSLCPGGCGQPVAESTAHWEVGPAYEAKSTTCRACSELHEAQRGKAERTSDPSAVLWHLVKTQG